MSGHRHPSHHRVFGEHGLRGRDQERDILRRGDSETLAAITGSIAEAAYGIPDWISEKAYSYFDKPLLDVVKKWEDIYKAEYIPAKDKKFMDWLKKETK